MDRLRVLRNTPVIILGGCIAIATIGSSIILSSAFLKFQKTTHQVITVTGSANQPITSDYVVWGASFDVRDTDLISSPSHPAGKPPLQILKTKQYLSKLQKIDATACPKDFQLAWLEYVQAWERKAELRSDTGAGGLGIAIIGAAFGRLRWL